MCFQILGICMPATAAARLKSLFGSAFDSAICYVWCTCCRTLSLDPIQSGLEADTCSEMMGALHNACRLFRLPVSATCISLYTQQASSLDQSHDNHLLLTHQQNVEQLGIAALAKVCDVQEACRTEPTSNCSD